MRSEITKREEEVMDLLWDNGPLTVSEMLSLYAEPKPHFNTVSTMVASPPTSRRACPTAMPPP